MQKLVLLLGALVLMLAPGVGHCGGWVGLNLRPVSWYVEGETTGQRSYVVFDQSINPDGCTAGGGILRVDGSTRKGQYLLSQIALSIALGKQVSINVRREDRGQVLFLARKNAKEWGQVLFFASLGSAF